MVHHMACDLIRCNCLVTGFEIILFFCSCLGMITHPNVAGMHSLKSDGQSILTENKMFI